MASRSDSDGSSDGWTSLRELVDAYNTDNGATLPEVRKEFERTRKAKILEEYYAPKNTYVGAVLVEESYRWWVLRRKRYRFKLRYDASDGDPRIGELLRSAHRQERKWSFLLNKRSQKILEQITYTLIVYLLGFLCPQKHHIWPNVSTRTKLDQAVASARKEMKYILSFARDSARCRSLVYPLRRCI
jgi:hypothetical protein